MRELFFCLMIFAAAVVGYNYFFSDLFPEEAKEIKEAGFPDISRQAEKSEQELNLARRDVTPDTMLPTQVPKGATLERLPAIEPPPPPPKPPKPKTWSNPTVIAAGILKSSNTIVRLDGIEPIPLKQKCVYQNGAEWPCGMFARTEMRQFVRGRTMSCEPVDNPDAENIQTRCKLANFDMSAWLVLTGWATPLSNEFDAELAEAKTKTRGQWRRKAP